MLLVLISLMMATIMTSAYLASRDNSGAIGENIASSAEARWAASATIELGAAILETNSSWRTSHDAGAILRNFPFHGATVTLNVMDLETGLAPTSVTEWVQLTAIASVNGVTQTASAVAFISSSGPNSIDVDLSEFAVFVTDELLLQNDATVTRWPVAPLSLLGPRIAVATRSTSAGAVTVANNGAIIDATVYHPPGASGLLVSNGGPTLEQVGLLDAIPMPAPPASPSTPPGSTTYPPRTMIGGTASVTATTRWDSLELNSSAQMQLRNAITVTIDKDATIRNGSKLIIAGNVKLVVFGDLLVDAASIEIAPGGALSLWVRGDGGDCLRVKDGFVGERRLVDIRDTSGSAIYFDPERINIYSLDPGGSTHPIRLEGQSVVKANMYVPHADHVEIRDTAALYGRVATSAINVRDQGSIFYDPALDRHAGFAYADSEVFDAADRIRPQLLALGSLDTTVLQSLADATATRILPLSPLLSLIVGITAPPDDPGTAPPTEPTPRVKDVTVSAKQIGDSTAAWE
jgi:hypothetical protein